MRKYLAIAFAVVLAGVLAGTGFADVIIWERLCEGEVTLQPEPFGTLVRCSGPEPTATVTASATEKAIPSSALLIDHAAPMQWGAIPLVDSKRLGSDITVHLSHRSVGQAIDWGLLCLNGLNVIGGVAKDPLCKTFVGLGYDRTNIDFEPFLVSPTNKVDMFAALVPSLAPDYDVAAPLAPSTEEQIVAKVHELNKRLSAAENR